MIRWPDEKTSDKKGVQSFKGNSDTTVSTLTVCVLSLTLQLSQGTNVPIKTCMCLEYKDHTVYKSCGCLHSSDLLRQTTYKSEDGKLWIKYYSQFRAVRQNNWSYSEWCSGSRIWPGVFKG